MNRKTAAAYLRCSTDLQDVERQHVKVQDYASNEGYKLVNEFVDKGITGSDPTRPAFLQLKEWISNNPGTILLVAELDRAARDMVAYVELRKLCRENGVTLRFLNVPTTGSPSTDQLLEGILAAVAEFESDIIRTRMMGGKIAKAKAGIPIISSAPFGYTYHKRTENSNPRVTVDHQAAGVIQLIFDLFVYKKYPIRAICRELIKRTIKTATGSKIWARTTVHGILRNPAYKGEIVFGRHSRLTTNDRKITKGKTTDQIIIPVEPIVDKTTWEKAQKLLDKNRNLSYPRNAKYNYLLSGLLYCSICGRKYTAYRARRTENGKTMYTQRFYRCSRRDLLNEYGVSYVCSNYTFKAPPVEERVWEEIVSLHSSPEVLKNWWEEYKTNHLQHIDQNAKRVKQIKRQLTILGRRETTLIDKYAIGLFNDQEVTRFKKKAVKMRKELEAELEEKELEVRLVKKVEELVPKYRFSQQDVKELNEMSFDQKQRLVRRYVKKIHILPQRGKFNIEFTIPLKEKRIGVSFTKKSEHGTGRINSKYHAAVTSAVIVRPIYIPLNYYRRNHVPYLVIPPTKVKMSSVL